MDSYLHKGSAVTIIHHPSDPDLYAEVESVLNRFGYGHPKISQSEQPGSSPNRTEKVIVIEARRVEWQEYIL